MIWFRKVRLTSKLQTCSKTHGCPWWEGESCRETSGSGDMGYSGLKHMAVAAAPFGLGTTLWVQMHPDVPVSPQLPPELSPQARSLCLVARADLFTGASHPAEKPGASATAWHKQQCLQGRVKRSARWGGLWWSSSLGKAGTQRRCCQSCRCPPCHCSHSLSARPGSQCPDGGGSHQS